jgi:hypothetical protein
LKVLSSTRGKLSSYPVSICWAQKAHEVQTKASKTNALSSIKSSLYFFEGQGISIETFLL